jgi:glycosyltransferase involved in cell wall biosynthesis
MKIALIAARIGRQPDPGTGPYPGDPANRVVALATALAELDHHVTVYARKDSPEISGRAARTPGVSVELIDAGPQEKLAADKVLPRIGAFAAELAQRWQQSPPDVAHASDWLAGLAALGGARDLGIPVVQTFRSLPAIGKHGHFPQSRNLTGQARLEAGIGRSAAAVLAGTSEDVAALVRRGLPQTAIKIVPDGTDTTSFGPSGPVAQRADRSRLLMFAPLADQQVSIILQALARVPDAELVIAGGPELAQLPGVPGYTEVTALARELRVQDRLILAGRVTGTQAPDLMRSADVLISLSACEPFSMTAVDAMACGVPVLATAAGVQRDAVIHGTTGFLVPSAEPDVLARRIRQLLAAPMLREGFGLAATTRARARYSWERIGRETLAVYSALQLSATQAA